MISHSGRGCGPSLLCRVYPWNTTPSLTGVRKVFSKDCPLIADGRTTEVDAIPTPRVLWIADHADQIVDNVRLSLALVNSAVDGLSLLRDQDFDVVLVSLPVPDRTSVSGLLEELQQARPGTPVVIHAPHSRATEVVGL